MFICTIRPDTLDFLDISLRTDTQQHIRIRISNPQSVPQSGGKITRGDERTQTDAVSACPRSHVLPHHTLAARPCLGCGPDCGPRGHEAWRALARLNGAGHSPTSSVVRGHSRRRLGLRLTRPSGRVRTHPPFPGLSHSSDVISAALVPKNRWVP